MDELENGTYTRREILSQPQAWSAALDVLKGQQADLQRLNPDDFEQILFTGCGSTYYLALAAASLTQEMTGRPCRALPASELWLYPGAAYPPGKVLLAAVSRSGETTETLHACQAFVDAGRGELLTLTCTPGSRLAKLGRPSIVLPSGQEQSVAQTRAFSTLLLGTVAVACRLARRDDLWRALGRLPDTCKRVLERAAPLVSGLGRFAGLDRFYFLGAGPRYGLACELSLKMKEMSLSHSEAFHFLEFRHGPMSMVTDSTLLVGLLSTVNREREGAVLREMQARGAKVLSIGEKDCEITFGSGVDEAVRDLLYLPAGQLLAFERALGKGLNPDRPRHLEAVVHLDHK